MNERIVAVLLAVLFFALAASAVSLEIFFTPGAQHFASRYSGSRGVANPSHVYFVDLDGNYSLNPADATPVSMATDNGTVLFDYSTSGNCIWSAIVGSDVNGTKVLLIDLNGMVVSANQKFFWSVAPSSVAVTRCSLDYNLSVQA